MGVELMAWREIERELVDILERRCGLDLARWGGHCFIVDKDGREVVDCEELARDLEERLK